MIPGGGILLVSVTPLSLPLARRRQAQLTANVFFNSLLLGRRPYDTISAPLM